MKHRSIGTRHNGRPYTQGTGARDSRRHVMAYLPVNYASCIRASSSTDLAIVFDSLQQELERCCLMNCWHLATSLWLVSLLIVILHERASGSIIGGDDRIYACLSAQVFSQMVEDVRNRKRHETYRLLKHPTKP